MLAARVARKKVLFTNLKQEVLKSIYLEASFFLAIIDVGIAIGGG
jgi:hypothetical protein